MLLFVVDTKLGVVTHYFDKIQVAVISLTDSDLKSGDQIHLGDDITGFTQTVDSMQVDHLNIGSAPQGSEVGLKVDSPVKKGDLVLKIG